MKFQAKKHEPLPKAIKAGLERKEARAFGLGSPFKASPIVGKPVQVKPFGAPAVTPKPSMAPLFSPGRLTVAAAVQSSRKLDADLAKKVSPAAAARVASNQLVAAKNAAKASTSRTLSINPPDPEADRVTGRKLNSQAFSRTTFRAPFQKSYNLRRSFGA